MQMHFRMSKAHAVVTAIAFALLCGLAAGAADARHKGKDHVKQRHVDRGHVDQVYADRAPAVEADCTPRNGWGGYYGNPWCRTGPSEAVNRRQYGYPAWVSKKYREW